MRSRGRRGAGPRSRLATAIGRRSVDAALPAPLPAVAEVLPVDLQGGGGDSLGVSGDVGRPSARIYQIAYRDMAVVMVVDKSLDL
jgi:hypothetical protein